MPIPQLVEIAEAVTEGKPRRAKVRTIMSWYGLKRRRDAGIQSVRGDLAALGLRTEPDFEGAPLDNQVRFVLGDPGETVAGASAEVSCDARYRITPQSAPGGDTRHRVVLTTWDSFERLRNRIVNELLASILRAGQNAQREDRDTYPFELILKLTEGRTPEDLAAWVDKASSLDRGPDGPAQDDPPEDDPDSDPEPAPDPSEALSEQLREMAASLRVSMVEETERIRKALDAKVDELRIDAVRQAARSQNNDDAMAMLEEMEAEYKQKNEALRTEIAAINEQLTRAHAQLEEVAEPANGDDAYPTMAATVALFESLSVGSPIIVHANARKSAARSSCVRRREVLMLLLTIRDLALTLFERGGTRGPIESWFIDRGYEYAGGDSKTASQRYGADREIDMGGVQIQMGEHVTLFENTNQCVSVYWWRDEPNRRLVVGYVGPHLRGAQRS